MTSSLEYFGVAPSEIVQTENRITVQATVGQTTFQFKYTVGYLDFFYNGAELDSTSDYVATDGQTVTLSSPCVGGESITFVAKRQIPNSSVYSREEVNALLSNYYGTNTGSADALAVSTLPVFSSYSDGLEIKVRTSAANTTNTPTVSFNSIGAKSIYRPDRSTLGAGAWLANTEITLRYLQIIDAFVVTSSLDTVSSPTQFDSSNTISTTKWAASLGLHVSSILNFATTVTLSATQAGSLINLLGSGNYVVTLPTVASVGVGSGFVLSNNGTGSVTISRNPASANDTTDSGSIVVIEPGARYAIISDGSLTWKELYWANQVSPNFSGTPTTTNPTQLDNSTRIANTAWTYGLGQNYGPNVVSSSSTSVALSQTSLGTILSLTGTTQQTVTLPTVTGLNIGNTITISKDVITTSITNINTFNTISNILIAGSKYSNITLNSGESAVFIWNGNYWILTGTTLLKRLGFPSTLGASGAQGLPTGFVQQWGSFSVTTSSTAVNGWYESSSAITFPSQFNNNVVHIMPMIVDANASGLKLTTWYSGATASGFTIWASGASANRTVSGTWSAIGY